MKTIRLVVVLGATLAIGTVLTSTAQAMPVAQLGQCRAVAESPVHLRLSALLFLLGRLAWSRLVLVRLCISSRLGLGRSARLAWLACRSTPSSSSSACRSAPGSPCACRSTPGAPSECRPTPGSSSQCRSTSGCWASEWRSSEWRASGSGGTSWSPLVKAHARIGPHKT